MADIILRVTPDELRRKAEEFRTIISDLRSRFENIERLAAKTKGYWQGEAGDADRSGYASYQEDIDYILKRLQEHLADLLAMAGIYAEAEQEAARVNNELKTDTIP